MSAPVCVDPVTDIINAFIIALGNAYSPTSSCPPDRLAAKPPVKFFAGDGAPLTAFTAHTVAPGCDVPFIWVRLSSRYRSRDFPSPVTGPFDCELPGVAAIEIGVAWCAVLDPEPSDDQYATEAEVGLDHSWRIDTAVCAVKAALRGNNRKVSVDTITPYGPEGGILAWLTTVYVSY